MKIYLDNIIFNLRPVGGAALYWRELVKRFLVSCPHAEFIEQKADTPNNRWSLPRQRVVLETALPLQLLRYMPLQVRLDEHSLIHSSYYRITKQPNVANVITVYDFNYELFTRGIRRLVHSHQKRNAIRRAAGIICISENTKNDLMHYYAKHDSTLTEDKVQVIPLAASDDFYYMGASQPFPIPPARSNQFGRDSILFVGSRQLYKNFDLAVKILRRLPKRFYFVIVGGGRLTTHERHSLAGVDDRYTHLVNASAQQLNGLYNLAYCLLYPSAYEGFGIPILEAMAAGCPVVCQASSSIPEVYGTVDNIVKGCNDLDAFVQSIIKLEDRAFRHRVISQGLENVKRFSWDKAFAETVGFYSQVLSRQ